MSCDGCKYEEVWAITEYCNDCDEYIHDKYIEEGDENINEKK